MSKSKKIISLLLSVIMIMSVLTVVPFTANAAEAEAAATAETDSDGETSGTTGECTWSLDGTVLTISGNGKMEEKVYNGSTGDIRTPWGKDITKVIIKDGVTSIGAGAFRECENLTSVEIPDSVVYIESWAFDYTPWLDSQPDGVVYAGKVAIGYKGEIPENYTLSFREDTLGIADSAFGYEQNIDSVTIPDSVLVIGNFAFINCFNLKTVKVSDSLISLGAVAFGSTAVSEFQAPDSLTEIGRAPLERTPWFDFQPDGVVYIGKLACDFKSKNSSITEVVLKEGTLGIAGSAFAGISMIESIILPNTLKTIGDSAFVGCTGLTSINIPDSVTSIGWRAFEYCRGLTSIDIPDSVTSIGVGAFTYCTGLTSVTIPDSVTSIGGSAFYRCTGLTSVTIPDSVTSIGGEAFHGCEGLTSVTIPDSVTSIDNYAFGYYYDDDWNIIKIDGFTIYGYEGSEAERYAKENEFTFVPLKSKTDEATGIIIDIPEDTDLTVKDITAEIVCDLPDGCNKMTAYDISLTKDGETVQPENIVPVKIPCTNENAKVYRFETDGKMTDMNAKYKDGYMVFTTDHFSVYVLAEPEPEVVTVKGDVTGDGKTNVQDCTAILRYVRKLDTLSEDQLKRADVTGDGKVNVQDVTRILRHVRKIETLY